MDLRIGQVLVETYRIERLIGEGGMGSVYEATHLRVPKRFAVKFLNVSLVDKTEALVRFRREAEIIATLDHPNIVNLFDYNVTDEGIPYIVLEYLDGEHLGRRLERGPLPLREAIRITVPVVHALSAAHARSIIHRDLKPENIVLCKGDVVKVVDFGIAKIRGFDLTGTNSIIGTVPYMSPEQIAGTAIDGRTDQFALAAIVYEMLSGEMAFGGSQSVPEVAMRVMHHHPPFIAGVSQEVNEAIFRAMAKEPSARFGGLDAFLRALVEAASRPDIAAAVVGIAPSETAPTDEDAGLPPLAGEATAITGVGLAFAAVPPGTRDVPTGPRAPLIANVQHASRAEPGAPDAPLPSLSTDRTRPLAEEPTAITRMPSAPTRVGSAPTAGAAATGGRHGLSATERAVADAATTMVPAAPRAGGDASAHVATSASTGERTGGVEPGSSAAAHGPTVIAGASGSGTGVTAGGAGGASGGGDRDATGVGGAATGVGGAATGAGGAATGAGGAATGAGGAATAAGGAGAGAGIGGTGAGGWGAAAARSGAPVGGGASVLVSPSAAMPPVLPAHPAGRDGADPGTSQLLDRAREAWSRSVDGGAASAPPSGGSGDTDRRVFEQTLPPLDPESTAVTRVPAAVSPRPDLQTAQIRSPLGAPVGGAHEASYTAQLKAAARLRPDLETAQIKKPLASDSFVGAAPPPVEPEAPRAVDERPAAPARPGASAATSDALAGSYAPLVTSQFPAAPPPPPELPDSPSPARPTAQSAAARSLRARSPIVVWLGIAAAAAAGTTLVGLAVRHLLAAHG